MRIWVADYLDDDMSYGFIVEAENEAMAREMALNELKNLGLDKKNLINIEMVMEK